MSVTPINLAVLVSGGGTTLQNLLDRIADGSLEARVRLVIGSRAGLRAEARAKAASLPYEVVARNESLSIEQFSERVFRRIDEAKVDLVCLAGWLSLLRVPDRWIGRVMNIHPALLPSFGGKGMYGHHVHEAVLSHGCKISGCTVHFVNNEYDAGPIIVQRCCPVLPDDTPASLAARVFEQECVAYPEAIRLFAAGRLRIVGRVVRIVDGV
jgi:formyltetrahydrofolate-dependent phosphoribosylglycinamide formyltransferase